MRQTDPIIKLANLKLNYKTSACRLQAVAHLCWLKASAFKQFPAQHRFKEKFISFDFNLYMYHHSSTETTDDGRFIQNKCRVSHTTSRLTNALSQRGESFVVVRQTQNDDLQFLVLDVGAIRRSDQVDRAQRTWRYVLVRRRFKARWGWLVGQASAHVACECDLEGPSAKWSWQRTP